MAGLHDQMPASAGRGRLRASHADREQVIGTLKVAFVQGMLAKDEFDLRVGQTFAARTYADLAALTADLPAGLTAAQPPQPARAHGERPVLGWPGAVITVGTVLYAGVWRLAFLLPKGVGDDPSGASALIFAASLVYLLVLIIIVGNVLALRRAKRSGGRPPRRRAPGVGGHASWRLPSAGPGGELPPADQGHRRTAEAGGRHLAWPPWPVRGPCAAGALAAGTIPASW
jgi:hypothetical protein